MRFFTQAAALAALAKLALAQGSLFINTPASLVECQPSLLTFGGGSAPYFLSVLPAAQVSANPLLNLPEQSAAGSYTWNVNLPSGTNITLQIRDGSGAVNYGSPVVIQAGTSTSCIDAAGASSASSLSATGAVSTTVTGAATAGSTSAASMSSASSMVTSTGSATSAVTAASGTPTMTAATNSTGSASNFTCSEGLLTYGISIASLDGTFARASRFFNNLTASQPTATNVSGTEVTFQVMNLTYSFNLTMNESTSTSLHQQLRFLGSEPVSLGNGTLLYDAFEDLTVYRNTTSNETEVQYFILGCFNDQPAGITILGAIISSAINYWTEQLSNSTSTAAARRLVRLF